MLIDTRHLSAGSTLQADTVVVGAGPAGITIAEELAAGGSTVLLLEAAARRHGRADDDALTGTTSGEPFPLVKSRHRGFGGTSTHWTPATGLRVRPLDAIDFVARPGRPGEEWPFPAEALDRYYSRAHDRLGINGDYRPERWFGATDPSPLAWAGGPELAMFQFAAHDCFTSHYDSVVASPAIQLVLESCVVDVVLADDGSAVSHVDVVGADGKPFRAEARTFVLAAGAIDNARILLASPGRDGRGVGNEHDNVGRYFMDHLSLDTGVIEPRPGHTITAAPFEEERRAGRDPAQAMLWLGAERITAEGLPNAAFWIYASDPLYRSSGVNAARRVAAALRATPRAGYVRPSLLAARHVPDVLRFAFTKFTGRGKRPTQLGMRILTEQLPNRDSRVQLSDRRDRRGLPRVDLRWQITSADLDVISRHQELLATLLDEQGVATLADRYDPSRHGPPLASNYHHIGTTRMHRDPRHGVVDPDGKVHSVANLYVAGSSTFPTGGYLNPTLTIVALAIRTADEIARRQRTRAAGT